MIHPWKVLQETILDRRGPFTLISSIRENPRNRHTMDFLRIDSIDWVCTVPVTPEGNVVLIRQFRQGVGKVCLELPAGCIDPGENNLAASARRELREETGYDSEDLEPLGHVEPNPGMMPVKCHLFLAKNVKKTGEQKQDDGEDIEVVLYPLSEIPEMIACGEITHAMIVATFAVLASRTSGMELRERTPTFFQRMFIR